MHEAHAADDAAAIADHVLDAVSAYSQTEPRDDIALVVLRVRTDGPVALRSAPH